jgi:uroporphyrinogen-III synthase
VHLLVTRPMPDAQRTADTLRARGHVVTVAPVLRMEIVSDADLGAQHFSAIALTSANAARAIANHPCLDAVAALPVFTVGRETERAARDAGFANVTAADGGVGALARVIAQKLAPCHLLYLAAEERAGDLAGNLAGHGFDVDTVVVYRMVPEPSLDLRAAFAGRGLDGVLHYSRRSAEGFVDAAHAAGLRDAAMRLTHYCLSETVAAPLRAAGANMKIAAHPDEEALLALL